VQEHAGHISETRDLDELSIHLADLVFMGHLGKQTTLPQSLVSMGLLKRSQKRVKREIFELIQLPQLLELE
jgi:hypothetical protein